MVKTLGYILFGICCISFLGILIVPLLVFPARQVAGLTVALLIIGEITFYVSLIFLGKAFFNKIKDKLKFRKAKKVPDTGSEKREDTTDSI
jgi:hypothetical protein